MFDGGCKVKVRNQGKITDYKGHSYCFEGVFNADLTYDFRQTKQCEECKTPTYYSAKFGSECGSAFQNSVHKESESSTFGMKGRKNYHPLHPSKRLGDQA